MADRLRKYFFKLPHHRPKVIINIQKIGTEYWKVLRVCLNIVVAKNKGIKSIADKMLGVYHCYANRCKQEKIKLINSNIWRSTIFTWAYCSWMRTWHGLIEISYFPYAWRHFTVSGLYWKVDQEARNCSFFKLPCEEGLVDDAFTHEADKDQSPLLR